MPTENLAGLVERVTFHNEENGFCVLRVKARGQSDLITVLGHAAMISAGEFVQASGGWVNDRAHGVQFKASFLKAAPPTTIEGIEKYLGSGMIRGIGPVYAKKLVRAFGDAVFDIIQQEPGRLREVTGIGPKRADRIVAGWAEQRVIREIMLFLHSNGVGTSRAARIYKTYGADAVRLISENPYRLARDIRGIGFRTADQIAAKLGIEKTALIRIRAGISYALAEAMDEGHCGLPVEELIPLTEKLLEVPAELVETALRLELDDGAVVADDLEDRPCVFLASLYRAELSSRSVLARCMARSQRTALLHCGTAKELKITKERHLRLGRRPGRIMPAKKRTEHKPSHQYIVIDAVQHVRSVNQQSPINPYAQHPVLLPYMVNHDLLLQPLPLPRYEDPSPGTDTLAVPPALVGDICVDFPCAAGAPHVSDGKSHACIGTAGRRVAAIQAWQFAAFDKIETFVEADLVSQAA